MVTEAGYDAPCINTGAVTDVVKLEYCEAMEPGPGAGVKQEEELFNVPKVTLVMSSSALDVALDAQ
jgi:hypothetical protein